MFWLFLVLALVYLFAGIPVLIEEIHWALHMPYREVPLEKNGPEPGLPGLGYRLLVWPLAFLLILTVWPVFFCRQMSR